MEFLDVYDENRQLSGRRILRGETLGSGEYFLAATVWIVNGAGQIMLTLRSAEKESWPGYWENTGGAVRAGESSAEGCLRELREETGICAAADELLYLAEVKRESAFFDIYAVMKNTQLSELRLQAGETDAAMWVTAERMEEMCKEGSVAGPVAESYRIIRPQLMEYIARCRERGKPE